MDDHVLPWQVYFQNGLPVSGNGQTMQGFENENDIVQGNAHVWLWRIHDGILEILLQKRSNNKHHYPGWYHLSAGGHIDLNETAVQAAVRETKEELGVDIQCSDLYYLATMRGSHNINDLMSVFIAKIPTDHEITLQTSEVESFTWLSLDEFIKMTKYPQKHKILDLPVGYFDNLTTAIRRLANDENH